MQWQKLCLRPSEGFDGRHEGKRDALPITEETMADLTRMAVSASSDDMLRQQVYQFAPVMPTDTAQTAEAVQKPAPTNDDTEQALSEEENKNKAGK